MPYPKNLINDNENVALDLRPHWWYFSKHILTGIPLFIVIILVTRLNGTPQKVTAFIVGAAAIVWAIWQSKRPVQQLGA